MTLGSRFVARALKQGEEHGKFTHCIEYINNATPRIVGYTGDEVEALRMSNSANIVGHIEQ